MSLKVLISVLRIALLAGGTAALIAGCGQSDYPELAQAKAFAVKVVTDELAETTAAITPPLTPEAARLPQVITNARVEAARRYGPVESLRPATCALPGKDMTAHCDGALFTCGLNGVARSGSFSAKIAVCHSDAAGWQVAAIAYQY